MLQPKRTKYRKQFKGKIHGVAKGGTALNFGEYGLKALEPNRVNAREIEAARHLLQDAQALRHHLLADPVARDHRDPAARHPRLSHPRTNAAGPAFRSPTARL